MDPLFNKVMTHRRALHQIPELGFDCFKTHGYLKHHMEALGYQTLTVARTGLIAIKPGLTEQGIAFRADMDGLPIAEANTVPYASKHAGVMHACGHDGHMAMLLGFATKIAQLKSLNKTVMFVFEPAEETYGGAPDIIRTDVFKQYDIEAIFALHLSPDLPANMIGITDGIMTAQDGDIDIEIIGKNAHGTMPHLGKDALLAGAALIEQYHGLISHPELKIPSTLITIGTFEAGEGRNIIAQNATIKGTIRALYKADYEEVKARIEEVNRRIEEIHRVKIYAQITDLHPPVINHSQLVKKLKGVLDKNAYKNLKPMMIAEDFSYYQQVMPGLFMMLGIKQEDQKEALHSARFDYDELVLMRGIELYQTIATMMDVF